MDLINIMQTIKHFSVTQLQSLFNRLIVIFCINSVTYRNISPVSLENIVINEKNVISSIVSVISEPADRTKPNNWIKYSLIKNISHDILLKR